MARRFLGVTLAPGVARGNLFALYLAAFATILLAASANLLQPYLLDTFLGLDSAEQGGATGVLGFANELVIVFTVGAWGTLSDRWGRRPVYVAGFFVVAAGFVLMPLATELAHLVGLRALYAVGIAACTAMLATVVADYVVNEDRGKANAYLGVMSGFGAMVSAAVVVKLPSVLTERFGYDGPRAGLFTYAVVAAVAAVIALFLWRGLKAATGQVEADRPPLLSGLRDSIAAARDPGVSLSYAASFVARPDLAVAAIFFPLWMSKHYVAELPIDVSAAERALAVARGVADGGMLIAIVGGAGLLFAPVIGILADRINRASAVAIALSLNFAGYGMTFFIDDPTGSALKLACVVIGFGQVSGAITTQVLVQQHAPEHIRGSVIGMFGVCGGVGIMVATWMGGIAFDSWAEQSPFVVLGIANGVVAIVAIALHRRIGAPPT